MSTPGEQSADAGDETAKAGRPQDADVNELSPEDSGYATPPPEGPTS